MRVRFRAFSAASSARSGLYEGKIQVADVAERAGWGRVVGLLAGLTIGGATALAPGVAVAAEPAAPGEPGRPAYARVTVPRHQVPPNAVRTDIAPPTPGAHGPAFQPAPSRGDVRPNIVGGTPAAAADHPSVVGLLSYYAVDNPAAENGFDWYVATCTGTVLSPTKVLTAAHCVTDLALGTIYVIAGRSNLESDTGGFVTLAASTWTHQNYNLAALLDPAGAEAPVNDVSVVPQKQTLPSTYPPVVLDQQGSHPAGTAATAVGYGVSGTDQADSGVLRTTTMPIRADAACAADLGYGYDTARMLCAGTTPDGPSTCGGDSGGPLLVNGKQVGITDWSVGECGDHYTAFSRISWYGAAVKEDLVRSPVVNLDWTGDGHADLFGRGTDGTLALYSGTGFADDGRGGFAGTGHFDGSFAGYTKVFRVSNWSGDGRPGIMGVQPDGKLYLHNGDGEGSLVDFAQRTAIGTGWTMFSDIMVTNNWTGNGRPNLMGRTPDGRLFLYTSNGNGGWLNGGVGIRIGTGWNMFNTVLTPGTWSGDGRQALVGRTPAGDLLLYKSDGNGGWLNGGVGIRIGIGWNMFSIFMSPGDWNGDNQVDLVGVTPGGILYLYRTNGKGAWLNNGMGQQIGTGWNGFTAVF